MLDPTLGLAEDVVVSEADGPIGDEGEVILGLDDDDE